MIRVGTFWCWLWGHKFIGKSNPKPTEVRDIYSYKITQTDFCIRCGKDKQ